MPRRHIILPYPLDDRGIRIAQGKPSPLAGRGIVSLDGTEILVVTGEAIPGTTEVDPEVVAGLAGWEFDPSRLAQVPVPGVVDPGPEPSAEFPNEPSGFSQLRLNNMDTFPGTGWSYSGDSSAGGGQSLSTDVTAPTPGSSVLRGFYPSGTINGFGAGRTFTSLPSATEIYWSIWTKTDANFINHPFQLKWFFVWAATEGNHMWIDWRHRFEDNGYPVGNGSREDSNLRLRFQGAGWNRPELFEQNVQPELVTFPRGEWVQIELHMGANNPSGGFARLWQNGTFICDLQGLTVPGNAFVQAYHEGVYGGAGFPVPQDQAWYVSQSYISIPE